jgi:hypothetical protein
MLALRQTSPPVHCRHGTVFHDIVTTAICLQDLTCGLLELRNLEAVAAAERALLAGPDQHAGASSSDDESDTSSSNADSDEDEASSGEDAHPQTAAAAAADTMEGEGARGRGRGNRGQRVQHPRIAGGPNEGPGDAMEVAEEAGARGGRRRRVTAKRRQLVQEM